MIRFRCLKSKKGWSAPVDQRPPISISKVMYDQHETSQKYLIRKLILCKSSGAIQTAHTATAVPMIIESGTEILGILCRLLYQLLYHSDVRVSRNRAPVLVLKDHERDEGICVESDRILKKNTVEQMANYEAPLGFVLCPERTLCQFGSSVCILSGHKSLFTNTSGTK